MCMVIGNAVAKCCWYVKIGRLTRAGAGAGGRAGGRARSGARTHSRTHTHCVHASARRTMLAGRTRGRRSGFVFHHVSTLGEIAAAQEGGRWTGGMGGAGRRVLRGLGGGWERER